MAQYDPGESSQTTPFLLDYELSDSIKNDISDALNNGETFTLYGNDDQKTRTTLSVQIISSPTMAVNVEAQKATITSNTFAVFANSKINTFTLNNAKCYLLNKSIASNTKVQSNGKLILNSGASSFKTRISSGGVETVESGGKSYKAAITGSGEQIVESGGIASSTTISNAGNQVVESKGIARQSVIKNGGTQEVTGGTASGTRVYGYQVLSWGGVASDTQIRGGWQGIHSGCVARSTTISSGGVQSVESGGSAIDTVQKVGGNIHVVVRGGDSTTKVTGTNENGSLSYSNGIASNFFLYGDEGGFQDVVSGGVAIGTKINGGLQEVYLGGIASDTSIFCTVSNSYLPGGNQYVFNKGIAKSTTVSSGGHQHVYSSGIASNTVVGSDGSQDVYSRGVASNTIVSSKGWQSVYSGGLANGITLNSGGTLSVGSGGNVLGITQKEGGIIRIDVKGSDSTTKVTGKNANGSFTYSNGVARNVILYSGGLQFVSSGGLASGTTINKGGELCVYSGGKASAIVVNSGGLFSISNKASVSIKSLASGGLYYLYSGGTLNLPGGITLYGKHINANATIIGGTDKNRVSLDKKCKFTVAGNMNMKKLHLNASNAALSATGVGNTLASLKSNKNTTITYDIRNISAGDTTYMLSLSTKNTQKCGSFIVNVKKAQATGIYELSQNIVQNKNTEYTINLSDKKQGIARLDGLGLIKGSTIYTVNMGGLRTVALTVSKTGKTLKGTDAKDRLTGTKNWDVFYGGKGNDTIIGENGHDIVVYDKAAWGKDVIAKTSGSLTLLFTDLKAKDIVKKKDGANLVITKKNDANQKITVKNWSDATHDIVFTSSMTAFNKFVKAASPTTSQITKARNEAFAKAGLASA